MWIVLGSLNDLEALWAYHGLKARGLEPLEFVSSESLACSLSWEHRLGRSGSTYTAFQLSDGRRFSSETIRGVLNRLVQLPMDHLAVALPAERVYAGQELTAFFLSWLSSLGRNVLNQPSPQGLFGRWRRPLEWFQLASRSGLATRDYLGPGTEQSDSPRGSRDRAGASTRMVIAVDDHVYPRSLPESVRLGVVQLSRLSGTRLLGAAFDAGADGDWVFAGATPIPDLSPGGDSLLDGLMEALTASP